MGGGIYVDNRNAREDTSVAVSGGKTLRSRWLNPEGGEADNWHGPYYLSPGSFIEFGYFIVPNRDATNSQPIPSTIPPDPAQTPPPFIERPGFRIVRGGPGDRPFRDPNGNIAPSQMVWTFFIY